MSKILIDYKAPEMGNVCPPPMSLAVAGRAMMLMPGVNVCESSVWEMLSGRKLDGVSVVVLNRKDMDGIKALIERTWSDEGLAEIAKAEAGWYGEKPRGVVASALAAQKDKIGAHKDRLAKKAKPEPKPKSEPKVDAPKSEPKSDPKPEKKPKAKPEPKPET